MWAKHMVTIKFLLRFSSYVNQPLPNSSNTFPDVWKKANVIPIHKKGKNQVIIALCLCYRSAVKYLYSFFKDHKLINPCQSGFKENESCIKQLVSITHTIYSAFDCNPSVEAQDLFWIYLRHLLRYGMMVWFGIWFNLYFCKSLEINSKLFLDNWFQRVLLNGKISKWKPVEAVFSRVQLLDQ